MFEKLKSDGRGKKHTHSRRIEFAPIEGASFFHFLFHPTHTLLDDATHIQGRSPQFTGPHTGHLWKHLHRHTQKCVLPIF
jgi:hypothetical protein